MTVSFQTPKHQPSYMEINQGIPWPDNLFCCNCQARHCLCRSKYNHFKIRSFCDMGFRKMKVTCRQGLIQHMQCIICIAYLYSRSLPSSNEHRDRCSCTGRREEDAHICVKSTNAPPWGHKDSSCQAPGSLHRFLHMSLPQSLPGVGPPLFRNGTVSSCSLTSRVGLLSRLQIVNNAA